MPLSYREDQIHSWIIELNTPGKKKFCIGLNVFDFAKTQYIKMKALANTTFKSYHSLKTYNIEPNSNKTKQNTSGFTISNHFKMVDLYTSIMFRLYH